MLNRVVGLGTERPATEGDVDAALAAIGAGFTFYVAVAPAARPLKLGEWLRSRGLEPGWGWMTFRRGVDDQPPVRTGLRLLEVGDAVAAAVFARVVRMSYGLPEAIEPVIARARDAGWLCWIALDGDEPTGAAALYAAQGVGYLGLAGTVPEHRGKGAQSALLATRIRRAAELGCDRVITGDRRAQRRPAEQLLPQHPPGGLRGSRGVAVTDNWLGGLDIALGQPEPEVN